MTTNPKPRRARRIKDLQRAKSAKGVAARERLLIEQPATWQDVGGFVTDGVLGAHAVRLLRRDGYGPRLAVTVDGRHRAARTLRGFSRLVAKMLFSVKPPQPVPQPITHHLLPLTSPHA